ncbi:MAG: SDR family NAD(P)-dependent oxidoreductase, partial [Thaumarchaeota archaeon]|nr:SDR family NAD(P)-dependent oxidoreductase [Nitrososphaerota archaeon]
MRQMMLQNKVALVTGASRGIGRAIAKTFASEGATVAINYNNSEKDATTLLKEVEAEKGRGILVKADVSKTAEVRDMVAKTLEAWGRVDILVNNAGI